MIHVCALCGKAIIGAHARSRRTGRVYHPACYAQGREDSEVAEEP